MTAYYVATLARYVVVDAENEVQAREHGAASLARARRSLGLVDRGRTTRTPRLPGRDRIVVDRARGATTQGQQEHPRTWFASHGG